MWNTVDRWNINKAFISLVNNGISDGRAYNCPYSDGITNQMAYIVIKLTMESITE